MTIHEIDLTFRQFALIDRSAEVEASDIEALQKAGIKVIEVTGDPHRVFAPITIYQVPKG